MPGTRFNLVPASQWVYLGPAFQGLSADVAALEAAGGGSGGPVPTGLAGRNVQKPDGSWTLTKAQADALHAAGASIDWVQDGSVTPAVPPAPADGLVDGDVVNGDKPTPTPITIPAGSYPTAIDAAGTANDKVVLTAVTGVTWVVDGVDHPSSGFTGTKQVAYTKGVATTVSAKPSSGLNTISGTSSWSLAFASGSQSVWTSESFNRTNAAIPSGNNAFTTNTPAGGTAVPVEGVGTGASFASNRLSLAGGNVGISINHTLTSVGIEAVIPTLPTGTNGVKISPARSNGGTAYVEAEILASGQVWMNTLEVGGSLAAVNTSMMIAAGGKVRVDKAAKVMTITVTPTTGSPTTYTKTFTNDFTPVRGYIQNSSSTTQSFADDLVIYQL